MSDYQKKVDQLTLEFNNDLSNLIANRQQVEKHECLNKLINEYGIKVQRMLVLHSSQPVPHISLFIFPIFANEDDLKKLINFCCGAHGIELSKVELDVNSQNVTYGYSIPIANGNELNMSLHRNHEKFTPDDLQRILNAAQEFALLPAFNSISPAWIGLDPAKVDAEVTA